MGVGVVWGLREVASVKDNVKWISEENQEKTQCGWRERERERDPS